MAGEQVKVTSEKLGTINVYVKGDLSLEAIILTVHDLGCNHTMYDSFINHPCMEEITKKTAWIHVDLPGQEDHAADLPEGFKFPSLEEMGKELIHVLDELKVTRPVVAFGEGAGANILAQFGIAFPNRVLGMTLIHCTGTEAGWMESLKDKIMGWKLDHMGMNAETISYLVAHRFGSHFKKGASAEQMQKTIEDFKGHLRSEINPKNLKLFVDSFKGRRKLVEQVKNMQNPVLLVGAQYGDHEHTVNTLEVAMRQHFKNKKDIEILEVEKVGCVMHEAPEKLTESFQYFLQGLGLVSAIPMQRQSKLHSSASMEEADLPKMSPPKAVSPLAQ